MDLEVFCIKMSGRDWRVRQCLWCWVVTRNVKGGRGEGQVYQDLGEGDVSILLWLNDVQGDKITPNSP